MGCFTMAVQGDKDSESILNRPALSLLPGECLQVIKLKRLKPAGHYCSLGLSWM